MGSCCREAAIGRAMERPVTTATAASGGSRKLLLGQRPAGCKASAARAEPVFVFSMPRLLRRVRRFRSGRKCKSPYFVPFVRIGSTEQFQDVFHNGFSVSALILFQLPYPLLPMQLRPFCNLSLKCNNNTWFFAVRFYIITSEGCGASVRAAQELQICSKRRITP